MTLFAPDFPAPLVVDRLSIGYRRRRRGPLEDVVHDVSFTVPHGSTVSLVGQSGSGKSTIARAVAGLLPHNGASTAGSVSVVGRDVTRYSASQWRPLRGSSVGFVPQDPLSSLDPLQRIGVQIAGALAPSVPRSEVPARVVRLLEHVGIRDAKARSRAFPHELSGGQLQRVLIAIAIAADPALLIADEPTSALDVTVQKRILDLIDGLREELGLGVLFITHDLALAQERSDEIVVLKDGVVREQGPAGVVLVSPRDPYTITLLSDAPAASPDRYRDRVRQPEASARSIISVSNVTKTFEGRGPADTATRALDDVSLTVAEGSVHALVGESGSGKTTLARIVAGLTGFDEGSTVVDGRELPAHATYANPFARTLQLVYQNPLSAVDPRYSVRRIIEEPLRIHGIGDSQARRARVAHVLDQVALPSTVLGRTAREISGGQRQRVALARTLVLAPDVLVLDEPTSALDVTVQAQIVDLLLDLREQHNLSYLFISHDLGLVRQIADTITVLRLGAVVESGSTQEIFSKPQDAYTRELLDAVPRLERRIEAVA
ncbi:ABC transporter ATP-binding protein [Mycetocola sp. 2940]|uniref:ABC transporter ATP-binding protein n=1 Tax=Mycetocola sp. 2940 TaxID=3156452 RepID=UPI0033916B6D